jgi:hypothetical protein
MAAKSGVNRRVNTGAMFSITLCFTSTSQEAITTAPTAPQGSSHDLTPAAARVGDTHYQPERNRQVQRRKRLGEAAHRERIGIGEYNRRDKCYGQSAESAGVEQAAHPLNSYQEGFISGEPRVDEDRYLLAQMVFQFLDVDRVNGLTAAEVTPPLVDLLLKRYRVEWSFHVRLPVALARLTPRVWPDQEWRAPAKCPVGSSSPLATAPFPRRAGPCLRA